MSHLFFLMIAVVIISVACVMMAVLILHLLDLVREQSARLEEAKKANAPSTISEQIDHTPFIKTSIEIIRMRKRLERSDMKDKRHLEKSLDRLEEYFRECGYEIINHHGVPYDEGMRVIANFVPSDELGKGEKLITKVIKPQINYKNLMIHPAEVEVSFGD